MVIPLKYVGAHQSLRGVLSAYVLAAVQMDDECCKPQSDFSETKEELTTLVGSRTEMKVPGRKNNVTSVIIFMETVSVWVLRAMSFISLVIFSMLEVDARDSCASSLLLCAFRRSRMLCSFLRLA